MHCAAPGVGPGVGLAEAAAEAAEVEAAEAAEVAEVAEVGNKKKPAGKKPAGRRASMGLARELRNLDADLDPVRYRGDLGEI